jgi:hypothetical protein
VTEAVIPSRALSSAAVDVTAVPPSVRFVIAAVGIVAVPVNVGDAVSDLELTAVWIAVNSASISEPLTTFDGLPDTKLSLAVKLVVFV